MSYWFARIGCSWPPTTRESARGQRHAAVHHQRLPGDPAGLVACEVDRGPADVPARALRAKRTGLAAALAHLGPQVRHHWRPHHARGDRVHADALGPKLGGDAL